MTFFNRRAEKDEIVEGSRTDQWISKTVDSIHDLQGELREHKELTNDQYNSAYARTAEVHYAHAVEEAKHRRLQEKALLARWQSHTDALQEQIGLLKTENGRLSRMLDQANSTNQRLQTRLDDTPRMHQIREWLSEIMDIVRNTPTTPHTEKSNADTDD